jgi:16S rRNA (uracil1498-N3)-methyltransferase
MVFDETFFFAPSLESPRITLDSGESHHLLRVLRLNPGDTVFVTDGRGGLAECRVGAKEGERVALEVVSSSHSEPETPEITLAAGLIRKSQLEILMDLAGQLPVKKVIFFSSDNMSVDPAFFGKTVDRLKAKAACALKQSKKRYVTEVEGLAKFDGLLGSAKDFDKIFLFEKLEKEQDLVTADTLVKAGKILALTGPEGGFSPSEIARAREKGFKIVGLGGTRLRAEAAGFAAIVKLLTHKGTFA